MSWRNWSGSVDCPEARVERPGNPEALAAAIRSAPRVRAVGSGHSFVPFWSDDDLLLDVGSFAGLQRVRDGRVRLGAGTPLHAIGPLLAQHGLALANMGDIDRQTLAGAIATGTHGTGLGLGSLSSRVTAVELADGNGTLRTVDAGPELAAARVALGMMGVMTAIELAVVPAYGLHERNVVEPTETCLETFETRLAEYRHHEFWWVPRHDLCIAKTLEEIALPARPRLDEIPFGEAGERWGASWQIFPSVRDLRFNEMEYAVPVEAGMACFAALRTQLRLRFPELMWPVEYRIVGGDDAWLSPTGGAEVATLSIHQAAEEDPRPLFEAVEPILREHGGRPHWGKGHSLQRSDIELLYPKHAEFVAVRRAFDPDGRFLTGWLAERFS